MKRSSGKKNERKGTRENTIKERQDELKAKFVSKLLETPIIQVVAAQTGIDRTTYYRWRDEDPLFKKQCHDARNRGVEFVNDMMESILIKNAKADNMTAVIFWLKNHHLEYNDKRYHEHEHHFRQDDILTEDRKKEIALSMMRWSEQSPNEDERNEDYEPKPYADEHARVDESPITIEQSEDTAKPPVKTGVAKRFVPKQSRRN